MSVTLTTDQKVGLHVDALTVTGSAAVLDGPPSWVSSDANVATVDPSGADVHVLSVGAGTCTMTVSATSFGQAVPPSSIDIIVTASLVATQLVITPGAPESK